MHQSKSQKHPTHKNSHFEQSNVEINSELDRKQKFSRQEGRNIMKRENGKPLKTEIAWREGQQNYTADYHLITLMVSVKLEEMGISSKENDQRLKTILQTRYSQQLTIEASQNSYRFKPNQVPAITLEIVESIFNPTLSQLKSSIEVRKVRIVSPELIKVEGYRSQGHSNHNQEYESESNKDSQFGSSPHLIQKKAFCRSRMCKICLTQCSSYKVFSCQHVFCDDCLIRMLQEDIKNANYRLMCPNYQCQETIAEEVVCALLGEQKYERFCYFRRKTQLESDPLNHFCSMPDCGQLLEYRDDKFLCKRCYTEFCYVCQQLSHVGDCDTALKTRLQETFNKYKIKKCPQCQSPIQKVDGCNQMKCKKCQFNFCWLCLRKFSQHHFRYYNCCGCPGMQFEDEEQMIIHKVKQFIFLALVPILLLIAVTLFLLLLPIFMVSCVITKPCEWACSSQNTMCEKGIAQALCCCLPTCLTAAVAFFLFLPRAILFALLFAPIVFFKTAVEEFFDIFF